jgi:hypothetical protein
MFPKKPMVAAIRRLDLSDGISESKYCRMLLNFGQSTTSTEM